MTRKLIIVLFVVCAVLPALGAGDIALAQVMIPPGSSPLSPPPPAPPPSPKIEIPVVPKLDEVARPPDARPESQGSFSDRITTCLQEGAAAGFGPGDRATYSRSCANQ
jgi:hypothetical protein